MERLLTVEELAKLLNCTNRRVYDLVETRDEALRLPAIRLGRLLRFRPQDLEAWVDRRPAA